MSGKRKAKTAKYTKRRMPRRSSYDKILIVCEGKKTEPYYLMGLVKTHKLNTANVVVDNKKSGSSPDRILKRAIKLWQEEIDKGDSYDYAFCVFDKDTHEHYDSTIAKISNRNPKGKFFSVQSVPCFEYWLILHFHYTTRPYAAAGNNSVGEVVEKNLKDYMPSYEKGCKTIFEDLEGKLEIAKDHATKALKAAYLNETDNPSTYIHKLVCYLESLGEQQKADQGLKNDDNPEQTSPSDYF